MITTSLTVVIIVGGFLCLSAVILAMRHISHHLSNYSKPQYQLHIVRILAMVPIYSITSWFALVIPSESSVLVLELIRDSYEAYVVYNFVVLLINYGGGHFHLCRYLEDQPRMPHPWPLGMWLAPIKMGPAFLNMIRAGVLQFVFIKPLGACFKLWLLTRPAGAFNDFGALLNSVVSNISVSCALYCLILFYHAAHDLLLPFRPFEKFLSVKAVVFFSFWQGVVLSLFVNVGLIQDVQGYTADQQATGLQDFLICFEMAIAAVAHYYIFSSKEYAGGDSDEIHGSKRYALLNVIDFRDVLADAKDRFHGDVGFENELGESEPLIVKNDKVSRDVNAASTSVYGRRHEIGSSTISADLEGNPWLYRIPLPPPT